ncbi:DUF308 domain-containing protein [Salinicoccus halitifaciens]|uniref:Uncharacterized membrane protein HdeD (DUF308 family) n=1 Tax=Salinicoccus halitifaciens TaxID=1073415 RepID=A0ABV2ECN4_9STAP|nr:DUF308 domain-containing protein [Salinicoccus halitifaciens]MCD2138999.1 DUF308 domain-containing protein [Salinicoccus halitifaciens]
MEGSTKKFNWISLIVGIIFIILAIFLFANPDATILAAVFLLGFGAIFKGVFEIFFRRKIKDYADRNYTLMLIIGIIDIIIGLLILFNIQLGIIALPILLGAWFIVDSVYLLITSSYIKERSTSRFWAAVIIGIIGILLGIMVLFNPLTGLFAIAFLMGIYFLIAGIEFIIEAFDS